MTKEEAIEVLHELDGTIYETQQVALDMAIKSLEQPTTKNNLAVDCVSRDAVNDLIIWYENGNKLDAKELLELVRHLPSVTPQEQRWIPVSERLPEADEEYHTFLVTDKNGRVVLSDFYLTLKDRTPYWSGMIDVIAWMSLPEPYTEEKRGSEDGSN